MKNDLGLQETDQVSKSDRRVHYLTRDQLEMLAIQHEIMLPDEHQVQDDEEGTSQSLYTRLADRVKSMEASLDEYQASLSVTRGTVSNLRDTTIEYDQSTIKQEQLEQRFTDLQEQMQQRFTSIEEHLPSLFAQTQQDTPEELQSTEEQRICEIEQRYQQQIEALEAQLATYQRKERQSLAPSKSKARKKKTHAKKLPASLASRSAFAQLHGVPDGTVASACSSGEVASVNGTWLYNSRTIHQALGDRGKHDFYQVFHTRPDFQPCKQCPHEQPT